jgi:hypothetical protein
MRRRFSLICRLRFFWPRIEARRATARSAAAADAPGSHRPRAASNAGPDNIAAIDGPTVGSSGGQTPPWRCRGRARCKPTRRASSAQRPARNGPTLTAFAVIATDRAPVARVSGQVRPDSVRPRNPAMSMSTAATGSRRRPRIGRRVRGQHPTPATPGSIAPSRKARVVMRAISSLLCDFYFIPARQPLRIADGNVDELTNGIPYAAVLRLQQRQDVGTQISRCFNAQSKSRERSGFTGYRDDRLTQPRGFSGVAEGRGLSIRLSLTFPAPIECRGRPRTTAPPARDWRRQSRGRLE